MYLMYKLYIVYFVYIYVKNKYWLMSTCDSICVSSLHTGVRGKRDICKIIIIKDCFGIQAVWNTTLSSDQKINDIYMICEI